jgi:hypothetical protein
MADDGEKLTFWFQLVTPHGPRHKVEKGKEPFDVPAGFGRALRPAPVGVRRRLKTLFTADSRGLTQTIEKRFTVHGEEVERKRRTVQGAGFTEKGLSSLLGFLSLFG